MKANSKSATGTDLALAAELRLDQNLAKAFVNRMLGPEEEGRQTWCHLAEQEQGHESWTLAAPLDNQAFLSDG